MHGLPAACNGLPAACRTAEYLNRDLMRVCEWCALPVPFVPVWVRNGALVSHRYSYAPPFCWISEYRKTSYLTQYLFETIFFTACTMASDWQVLRAESMFLCWPELLSLSLFLSSTVFSFSFILPWIEFVGLGCSVWWSARTLSLPCNTGFLKW